MLKSKSWKTTLAGALAIVIAIASALQAHYDGDPTTAANWEAVGAAVIAGIGLLFARDNDKRSEAVGAGQCRQWNKDSESQGVK